MRIISDKTFRTIIVGIAEYDFNLEEEVENEYEVTIDSVIENNTNTKHITKVRRMFREYDAIYFYDVSEQKAQSIIIAINCLEEYNDNKLGR